jgi:aspartate kinase
LPGTLIHNQTLQKQLPAIIVLKEDQAMLEMSSKDFSFVGEHHVGALYHLFEKLKIKPNLTQNGAISFICIFDNRKEKIEALALEASELLDVTVVKELSLLTIRHYNKQLFDKLTEGKKILLRQQTVDTIQVLVQ